MTKTLSGILAFCLTLALIVPANAQHVQLLQNGDFETWTVGRDGPPDGWTNDPFITSTRDEDTIHGGIFSANLTWTDQDQANCDFMHTAIPVIGDSVYACSVWVYDTDPAGQVRVSLFSDAGNAYSSVYSQDVGWQELTFTWTAPSTATSVQVSLRAYDISGSWDGDATVFADDYRFWGPQVQGNSPPSITNILRYPYPTVNPTDNLVVEATISDFDGSIVSDSIYKRVVPGSFTAVAHDSTVGNVRWFTVGMYPAGDSIEYYVVATDNIGARTASSTRGYTVFQEPTSTTPIYAIQHTTNGGILPDCYPTDSIGTAQTISGIVVGRYERSASYRMRFFLQDSSTPWSGIYVYQTLDTVQVGDSVTVTGIATEYYAETEMGTLSSLVKHSHGHAMPAVNVITCATLGLDSCSASAEPYEGMLIRINNITLIDTLPAPDVGEFLAVDGSGDTCIVSNDLSLGGVDSCVFELGHTYSYIRGIGRYTYGHFRIMPRTSADIYTAPQVCTGSNIFNVQNSFDPGGDTTQCWPSPRALDTVSICGIVTAVSQGTQPRFFMQDQANTAWGGMYCYDYTLPSGDPVSLNIGDYIQVTGFINEYYGWTEIDTILALTVLGTNQPLPDTTVVTVANLAGFCEYTIEPYEDILVRVNNVTVVSDNGFNEFWIRDNLSSDSIRIDSDLWQYGLDQPNPVPSVGAIYDYVIGVVKWQGRQGGGYDRGWMLLPRFGSDYEQAVIPEPEIADVWSTNNTTLIVTFDRVMDATSVGNPANYATVGGLSITGAILDPVNHRKAILTTGTQPDNVIDTIIVSNVCDSLGYCMTAPHRKYYHSGLTTIATVNTPDAGGDSTIYVGHIVTVKGVIVSDSSMSYPTNPFVNDGSGPPYNGVLIYTGGLGMTQPVMGDTVKFTAKIDEYYRATELKDLGVYNNFSVLNSGPSPVPNEVTAAELNADKEGFEGVLVTICDSFIVTNTAFDAYGFTVKSITSPNDSLIIHKQTSHTTYSYVPVLNDIFNGITGVFRYQRDQYRLMPRFDADFNSYDTWCGGGGGCVYLPGDINGNGSTNGIDVSYGVIYFKGGNEPPVDCGGICPQPSPFYAAGDVNGNCVFNGIDITFFVNYLKGIQPALLYCATCPPATGYTMPEPAYPTLAPTLRAKTITGQVE